MREAVGEEGFAAAAAAGAPLPEVVAVALTQTALDETAGARTEVF